MPQWEPERTVTQSVLERLIDREPKVGMEPAPPTGSQSVGLLKASLRRDLEWLLGIRPADAEACSSREFQELEQSLYNYGAVARILPRSIANRRATEDRTCPRIIEQANQSTASSRNACKQIKEVIADWKSRQVSRITWRMLRFQIEGLLDMDPAPELISFDTVLHLSSGEYQVKGDITVRDDLLLYYERRTNLHSAKWGRSLRRNIPRSHRVWCSKRISAKTRMWSACWRRSRFWPRAYI